MLPSGVIPKDFRKALGHLSKNNFSKALCDEMGEMNLWIMAALTPVPRCETRPKRGGNQDSWLPYGKPRSCNSSIDCILERVISHIRLQGCAL